jgi:predicted outer membrane repeat protein
MSFGELAMKCKVLVSSIILLYMAGFATADTLNVPSGSYPTIQSAIDAAVDGDEVVVADGTYTDVGNRDLDFGNNLPFGQTRAITVRSANGPANCIIDCQGLGRAFNFDNFEDDSSVVEGFTIKNGSADYGGGIECYFASPKISNCIITGNSADYDGGGIDCYYSSPVIVNCVIAGNTAGNDGAGIESWEGTPAITNCLIQGNAAAAYGGAVDCYNSSPTIANCTIVDNSGLSDSGGIYAPYAGSSPTIIDCIIWGNGDDLIEDGDSGAGNISDDPLFRTGPLGDYYLSQIAAGQLADSNCVDAGSADADDPSIGLGTYTTRTDSISDANIVDMGYHYPDSGPYVNYQLTTSVVVNDPGATGTISPATGTYRQFTEVVLTATPDGIGYKVKEWTGTDNIPAAGEPNNIVTMSGNKLVTVEFEPRIVYQLTTVVVGGLGGTIAPSTGPQYEGDVVMLTATPDPGYRVYRWTGTDDDSSVGTTNYVTMDSNKTVYVEFISDFVHLDVAVIGTGGTINPARGGNYPTGTVVSLEAIPDLHFKVKEWTGADNVPAAGVLNNTVTMTEDKSVTVEFEPLAIYELTVSVVDSNGGTAAPTAPSWLDYNAVDDVYSYYEGTVVTITAAPDMGWRVKAWYGTEDDNSVNTTNTVIMDSNSKAVSVEFELGFPLGTVWVCDPVTEVPYPWNFKHPYSGERIRNPYTTIQAAINKAFGGFVGYEGDEEASPFPLPELPVIQGDLIIVSDGVYTGPGNYNLDLLDELSYMGLINVEGKHITIRSEHGPENCIIDCDNQGRAFYLHATEDNNSVIEGFTIKNGLSPVGGGLNIEGISAPIVRNCIIQDSDAFSGGGGVYMAGPDPEDTTYTDLLAELEATADELEGIAEELLELAENADPQDPALWEAAIEAIVEATAARITAIIFAEFVEGIGEEGAPVPRIDKCKIINNTTSLVPAADGGGIFCQDVSPLIIGSEIIGNSAFNGGGIYSYSEVGSTPAIINCLITGNESVDIGGAVYLYTSDAVINLCTIVYNTGLAYGIDPIGGIASREASPVITNCIIGRNGNTDPNMGLWGDGVTGGDDLYECSATYSCIENSGDGDGEGNISLDPLFVRGKLGDFYLFQGHYDPDEDSPCVDAGEQYILSDLRDPPPDGYNLDVDITTSIMDDYDIGFADMGYHYPFCPECEDITYRVQINAVGNGSVDYYMFDIEEFNDFNDFQDVYLGTIPGGSNVVEYFLPGTIFFLEAHAEPDHWGYWYGTEDDTSFNTFNFVAVYSDSNVTVEFEPILRRTLHVPADYPLLQDAIDAAKYQDKIVLAPAGADNPYFTSQGYTISNNKAITISSVDPNDPDVVAATVIQMESPQSGGVGTAFTFENVGADTLLAGITIRGFEWVAPDGLDGDDPLEPGGNGSPTWGGGIVCVDASPTIRNCIIEDCNITGGDGGLGMPGTDAHPDGVEGGWPGGAYGGGMAILAGSNPTVIGCTFDNCRVNGGSGGDGGDGLDFPPVRGLGGRGGGWYYGVGHYWYDEPWPLPYSIKALLAGAGFGTFLGGIDDPNVPVGDLTSYDFYTAYSGLGGAVYVAPYSRPKFIDCTFTNNTCSGGFCGITGINGEPISTRLEPGLRWVIDSAGAAVFCDEGSSVEFVNCVFTDNWTDPNRPIRDFNEPYDPVTNYDNDDIYVGFGGAVAFKNGADVTFDDCVFEDNSADKGGAIYSANANPQINDCNFEGNVAQSGGGALVAGGLSEISGSNFTENEASGELGRGGAICSLGANAKIDNCMMYDNDAGESGGGIYISSKNDDGNDLIVDGENILGYNIVGLYNCLIVGNSASEDGGGISASWDSEPAIVNCTIADNMASRYGGGLYGSYGTEADVLDSIIWGNSANFGSQIAIRLSSRPSTVAVTSSNVQGAQSDAYVETGCMLFWDPNNLYTDPFFEVGPLGDYYLSQIAAGQPSDSPCVDVGSDLASRAGLSTYTTRTDHIFDKAIVDMGFHYSVPSLAASCRMCDFVFDYIINFRDFSVLALYWLEEECSEDNNWCQGTDLSFDSYVNNDDLFILAECWLVEDDVPPEPNPSQWRIEPYSAENMPTEISMTAEPAVDNWDEDVEYYFKCAYGACNDSDWQSDANYTDTGLATSTEYGYRVQARDDANNKTMLSPIRYAITGQEGGPDPTDNTSPSPNPMTWATVPHTVSASAIQMLATTATDDSGGVEYFFDETSGNPGGTDSGWVSDPNYIDTGLVTGLTYTYRVKARDVSINRNETGWSSEESATPEEGVEPPPTLVAPSIISATQFNGGFDWYNVIGADTLVGESALYYRFICLDNSDLNSGWVPSTGSDPIPSGIVGGIVSYDGEGVTYTVPVGPAHMMWEWIVCGSNSPTGDVTECSGPSMVPL